MVVFLGGQVFDLERDSTCDLKDTDFPGRIWVDPPSSLPPFNIQGSPTSLSGSLYRW